METLQLNGNEITQLVMATNSQILGGRRIISLHQSQSKNTNQRYVLLEKATPV